MKQKTLISKNQYNAQKLDLFKPHEKYRNIIFDLGAVLVYFDAHKIIASVFKDEQQVPYELFGAIKTSIWYDMDRGIKTPQEVTDLLADQYDKTKLFKFIAALPTYLSPLDEGIALLDAVKARGFKTFVLSNLSIDCYNTVSKYDFLKKVDGAVYSSLVKLTKPDPEIYQYLLTKYSLVPEECLFIDDLSQNIDGAKSVGIDGIVLTNHTQVKADLKKLKVL
jgi:putative hydrolase of the HAD superfamily